jgi:hypothetical protein
MIEVDNKDKEMHGLNNGDVEAVNTVVVQIKNMFKMITNLSNFGFPSMQIFHLQTKHYKQGA